MQVDTLCGAGWRGNVRTYGTFQSGFTWLLSQYYERDLVQLKPCSKRLSVFFCFSKSSLLTPKVVGEREGPEGEADRFGLFPCPSDHPLLLCPQAQIEKRSALASKRKTLLSVGWGGQGSFGAKMAIFQLLKQPAVLEENMRNWKEGNAIFNGFVKALEVRVV